MNNQTNSPNHELPDTQGAQDLSSETDVRPSCQIRSEYSIRADASAATIVTWAAATYRYSSRHSYRQTSALPEAGASYSLGVYIGGKKT